MVLVPVFAVVGLVGLAVGVFALRSIAKTSRLVELPPHWRRLRLGAVILGIILGLASWPLTFWMGYPVATPEGQARAVGLPFFAAFFDSAGRDYVGPVTFVSCVANSLFWFLVPQLFVAASGRRWRRRRIQEAA
jgi:hypothetical protein